MSFIKRIVLLLLIAVPCAVLAVKPINVEKRYNPKGGGSFSTKNKAKLGRNKTMPHKVYKAPAQSSFQPSMVHAFQGKTSELKNGEVRKPELVAHKEFKTPKSNRAASQELVKRMESKHSTEQADPIFAAKKTSPISPEVSDILHKTTGAKTNDLSMQDINQFQFRESHSSIQGDVPIRRAGQTGKQQLGSLKSQFQDTGKAYKKAYAGK